MMPWFHLLRFKGKHFVCLGTFNEALKLTKCNFYYVLMIIEKVNLGIGFDIT